MADVTITGAGAHAAAAATDHIPASKAGVKGYLTPAQIATFVENDQALTGDVTKAQNTSATVIAALAVTVAKMSLSATLRLVGRTTAGAGAGEELTVGAGLVLATGALGRAALTGDVTAAADGNATTIAAAAVTYAKMQNVSATALILGRKSAGAGSPEEIQTTDALDFVGATQGQMLYRGASAWTALAPGVSGQALLSRGAGANPAWFDLDHPGYVPGNWYLVNPGVMVGAGTAPGVNLITFSPLELSRPMTVSDLGARITTAQASQNFQLAIYASDPTTKLPTGLPLAVTGDISTASATVVTADITGANVFLPPALYWGAWNTNGSTAALQSLLGQVIMPVCDLVGSTTAANLVTSATSTFLKRTFSQTYGTWPDMTSNATTEATAGGSAPVLLMKAA